MLAFEHHINTAQRLITSVWFIVFLNTISAIVAFMGLPVWMLFATAITASVYTIVLFENAQVNTQLAKEAMKDKEQLDKLLTVAKRADKTIKFASNVGLITSLFWFVVGAFMLLGFPFVVEFVEMQNPYFLSPAATILVNVALFLYTHEHAKLANNVTS